MARTKKSRTMRGKLGKTGSKEQMKEQRKAQKSKTLRRFQVKKSNQRKEQAQKKLHRLGLAVETKEEEVAPRARRFVFPTKQETAKSNERESTAQINSETTELSTSELLDAFTETE
ncbi:hypothetical protein CBF23_007925 [Marinomonas agarivorans]|nr:hypothetical protein CBF23_007925 [Marinomonas agarivorans]